MFPDGGGDHGARVEQTMADFKRHQTICSPRDINKITKKKFEKKSGLTPVPGDLVIFSPFLNVFRQLFKISNLWVLKTNKIVQIWFQIKAYGYNIR